LVASVANLHAPLGHLIRLGLGKTDPGTHSRANIDITAAGLLFLQSLTQFEIGILKLVVASTKCKHLILFRFYSEFSGIWKKYHTFD